MRIWAAVLASLGLELLTELGEGAVCPLLWLPQRCRSECLDVPGEQRYTQPGAWSTVLCVGSSSLSVPIQVVKALESSLLGQEQGLSWNR